MILWWTIRSGVCSRASCDQFSHCPNSSCWATWSTVVGFCIAWTSQLPDWFSWPPRTKLTMTCSCSWCLEPWQETMPYCVMAGHVPQGLKRMFIGWRMDLHGFLEAESCCTASLRWHYWKPWHAIIHIIQQRLSLLSPWTLAMKKKQPIAMTIATTAAITTMKLKAEKAEKAELKQKAVPALRVARATLRVGPGLCLSSKFTSSQVDATRSVYTRRMWDIQLLPMPGMLQQQPFKKTVCGAHEISCTDIAWSSLQKPLGPHKPRCLRHCFDTFRPFCRMAVFTRLIHKS